jgi:hypothetical protein
MRLKKLIKLLLTHKYSFLITLALIIVIGLSIWQFNELQKAATVNNKQQQLISETQSVLAQVRTDLENLQNSDPHKTNIDLQNRIDMIENTYQDLLVVYEKINDFENNNYPKNQVTELRTLFANLLNLTSKREYEAVVTQLADTTKKIAQFEAEQAQKLLALTIADQTPVTTSTGGETTTAPVTTNNEPPSNGYSRQVVSSDAGQFTVSIVAGDLSSTRVIVDTASTSDCFNDCPVLPLADYVARNGAYAGVNGSYFCPASYPSCAGKTNTFDLLVMNKDKVYFNSDNNVYSVNPGVIFSSGSMRFIGAVSGWGRDTGIDSMLSNYPMLVSGGNVIFGGDDDPKKGSKGNRSFVSNRGNTVYIGVVHSATVAESARVMKAMGMENALNLDDGGSTALWAGGYKVGPGRALPNVILFTHR